MIAVKCPQCGFELKIPEQYAGQRGRCKKCGGTIDVPSSTTSSGDVQVNAPIRDLHIEFAAGLYYCPLCFAPRKDLRHDCPNCGRHYHSDDRAPAMEKGRLFAMKCHPFKPFLRKIWPVFTMITVLGCFGGMLVGAGGLCLGLVVLGALGLALALPFFILLCFGLSLIKPRVQNHICCGSCDWIGNMYDIRHFGKKCPECGHALFRYPTHINCVSMLFRYPLVNGGIFLAGLDQYTWELSQQVTFTDLQKARKKGEMRSVDDCFEGADSLLNDVLSWWEYRLLTNGIVRQQGLRDLPKGSRFSVTKSDKIHIRAFVCEQLHAHGAQHAIQAYEDLVRSFVSTAR